VYKNKNDKKIIIICEKIKVIPYQQLYIPQLQKTKGFLSISIVKLFIPSHQP